MEPQAICKKSVRVLSSVVQSLYLYPDPKHIIDVVHSSFEFDIEQMTYVISFSGNPGRSTMPTLLPLEKKMQRWRR